MMNPQKRYIECLVLFFVAPLLLYFVRHQMAFRVFYLLFVLVSVCTIMLVKDPLFDRTIFWRKIRIKHLRKMAVFFLPAATAMGLFTYFFLPSRWLAFPTTEPVLWLIIMVLYPLLLALPQELLFRCFFFHRYQSLFGGRPGRLIFFNALSFGLSHIFYGNWVAPVLTFFGGLLFAWRYHTSASLLTVGLEHAVWGNYLFTIGIGWYFYSGAIT